MPSGTTTPDPRSARPLRKDAERNRQRILRAAGEVFADRGLAVTLDEIARRAGVGVGTVYRRYPNKDALIDALFEERLDALAALAEAGLADPDPWHGFVSFLEHAFELQAADRGLKELVCGTAHGRDRVADARARLKPLGDALVARAQAAGQLRADAAGPDLPLIHLMIGAILDASGSVRPELWRRFLAVVVDGLRATPGAGMPLPEAPLDDGELDRTMRAIRPTAPAPGAASAR
jgi:AcrR family transcriptional regulator